MTRRKGLPPDYNAIVFVEGSSSVRVGVGFEHATPKSGINVLLAATPAGDTFHLRAVVPAGVDGLATASSTQDTGRGSQPDDEVTSSAYVVERSSKGERWHRIGQATRHRDRLGWKVVVALYPKDGQIIIKDAS